MMSTRWLKILLAYDGSACAQTALATAIALAKAENALLNICSILDPIEVAGANAPMPPTQAALEAAHAQAQRRLDAAVAKAREAGIDAQGTLAQGDPAYEIVQCARQTGVDAIVMGTHGRTGLKRLFLGSVAEETLRTAHVPVVVVHQK